MPTVKNREMKWHGHVARAQRLPTTFHFEENKMKETKENGLGWTDRSFTKTQTMPRDRDIRQKLVMCSPAQLPYDHTHYDDDDIVFTSSSRF